MVEAPDFDRKMLLLATQLANESDMKALLLAVLEALLNTIQGRDGQKLHVEALILIRCIIRLIVKLMAEPGTTRYADPVDPARITLTPRATPRPATTLFPP